MLVSWSLMSVFSTNSVACLSTSWTCNNYGLHHRHSLRHRHLWF